MDNLTHSLVGLMMSRSGIDRKIPRAAPLMIVAANLPDVDVISLAGGTLSYLSWHRGYTHSFAFAPLMALIAALIVLGRRISCWAYFFSLAGVLSHLLLDWTNVYGVRLLLPFSARWLRLDQTGVVDPWIWAILLLAVAAPALARMVSGEIGAKSRGPKRGWAWCALIALAAYEGARSAAHQRALAEMGAHLFNGSVPQRVAALAEGAIWRWRGVVEGPGWVEDISIDLRGTFDPDAGRIDYAPEPSPAIEAARATPAFQKFAKFDQLPFWKITPAVDGTAVELIDLRFGTPREPGLEARALVDAAGRVAESSVSFFSLRPGTRAR
ncbi:MAG TPA: metal-dependent hydrolase [Bryobacteraceae bacterium]|jgi:inner membrane protein|nr:metal-dependent hydrolase [Bryobacteraceae bacterium]